jgi:hypothetical protein
MIFAKFIKAAKYVSAHAGSAVGIGTAIFAFSTGNVPLGLASLSGALASFGVNLTPKIQNIIAVAAQQAVLPPEMSKPNTP